MSGLEKFQASEAWRSNFKKFLFMERKPEIVKSTPLTESQRYSLDIAEDLKNIIEQKKQKKSAEIHSKEDNAITSKMSAERHEQAETEIKKNMNRREGLNRYEASASEDASMWQKASDESFVKFENMCEKTASDCNSTLFKYLNGEVEEKRNHTLVWQKTSDESFEALERMCDKTASDPNSTLFKYLHTDHKEEILAAAKKRSTDGKNSSAQDEEDQLLSKLNNCTLLEEVEAPSRMWENTICGDTILQTSPVKLVGLLRPSTIIEEAPDDSANSDVSSQASFQTATKSAQSDVSYISSSAYDTAHETTNASNKNSAMFRIGEPKEIDVDQDLLVILDEKETEKSPHSNTLENTIVEPTTLSGKSDAESNVSVNLIDLEKTFGPADYPSQVFPQTDKLSRYEESEGAQDFDDQSNSFNLLNDSVIELISDDDDDDDNIEKVSNINVDASISNYTYSFNVSNEDDKENDLENQEQPRNSMQFNDTMEEVEYLLKRGMEYMAAGGATRKSPEKLNILQTENDIIKEKLVPPTSSHSASKAKSSKFISPAKITPLTKTPSSSARRYDMDIKPFPKLDIFAKPLAKEQAAKQQKFSHIISPIGTYMKKTAQTPLMSSINSKTKDYFNSTAVMELENESRLYKPIFQMPSCESEDYAKLPGLDADAKRPLPKKAYISSNLKHIVDERTPITIPASKKIQKYLENAMMPAVLRHEGKLKVPGGIVDKFNTSAVRSAAPSKIPLKESDTNSAASKSATSHIPRRNNVSLADLSLMSGDVSMYTIMDAQKF